MKHRRNLTPDEVREKAKADGAFFDWCRENNVSRTDPRSREEYAEWYAQQHGSDSKPYPY